MTKFDNFFSKRKLSKNINVTLTFICECTKLRNSFVGQIKYLTKSAIIMYIFSLSILAVDIAQIFELPQISKEVEEEANSYFQRIYNQSPHPTLPIEEVKILNIASHF